MSTRVSERQARQVAEAARETTWARPSFAKGLYMGQLDMSLVHPYPGRAEADRVREDAFLKRLEAYCATLDGGLVEREDAVPDSYLAGLAELGCFGMKIPVEYGGLGLSTWCYGRALMLVGSVHPSIGALLSAHQSIGVPEPVKLIGTEDQKARFLPRCAAGAVTAFLLTEPDVGSDPARMASTATPTEDGSAYLLDGVKLWTTNGVIAELVVVMARVPPHDGARGGITAFVVETDSDGITVENRNRFMGLRGLENGVTRFHRVRVPVENRLGAEGQGLKLALTTLNEGRLSIPALCAGGARWILKIAREWSTEREQWGRPIGHHEAVASKISAIAVSAYALDSVFELSARLNDLGANDIRIEAALAKLWASETTWRACDELVQIRGGRGYETADSLAARGERAVPVEQVFRDMRINRIFEGSSEIMRLFIAREAVDAHLAAAGALGEADSSTGAKAKSAVQASGFYAGWLPRLVAGKGTSPGGYREFGELAPHVRSIERSARKLARNTFYAMSRWRAGLEHRQVFLGRIVDIGAELFAMAAVCSRASSTVDGVPAEAPQRQSERHLADVFCQQARRRVDLLFDGLWHNTDDADRALAESVLAGDLQWLERGIIDGSEGTGPWIALWEPGPSSRDNRRRRYR